MKKILPITAFSSLMSMQCIFAQVTPAIPTQIRQVENRLEIEDANQTTDYKIQLAGCTKIKPQSEDLSFKIEHRAKNTTNYELQTTNCDNSAGSLNCHLMMNPSSAEEGIQAVHKAFGTSEQSAIAVEGSPLGHQAMAVVPETRMTPKVSVRAESSEIEEGMFSSPSNQVLRLREGGPKTKNRPTGGLKYTGDTSEEESDRDDVDPDLESENLPSRSPEGVQSMDSQVNKYLKNEIINNIYTECLAEVAKLTLNGRVAAENYSLEEAEWKIAESAAKHYIGDCESDLRIFERESAEAQEISKKAQEHAQAVEFDSKKGNDSNQVIAFVIACQKARVAYAESDYKVKKCAVQLAEARLRAANTTLWAIEVRKHSSRDAIDKKLAERQKIEADALDAFTKAKGDLETKAALLSAAEDAIAAVKKSSSTGTKSSTNRGAALTENMKASKEAGSISEASIMRPIEPPVLSDDIAEKIGKALLEGKGKITIEPIENSENEEENRERWELRRKADESYNKAQRAWQGYKNRSSSIDSVISDVSFNTAQNEDTFYKQDEKDWEELAKKAEKRLFPEKSVDDPILLKELLKKWKQKDRTAVMKKYCHDNTPRWIARAKADAAENNYRIVVKETESFSADAEIARRNRDVTEKEWSDLADQEESVIQAQEDVSSAQKELKQSDQAANKLLEMIQKQDQGVSGISQNSEGQQESDPEVYFQTSGEEEALECYTRDVIGKARRDALESVLKNNSSFVEQLWNDRVMEARKAVNNAKKEAQKKTAKRKKKIENALRKGVDAFNDEVKRLSGIQAVWMARLEEAAQSHADGNTTVWDKLTEEERNAYNAITFVRNKVKGEAIQKDLEKAKKALKEAQEKADTTWFNKKAALEEVEKAEAELKKLEVAEAERQKVIQEAIQWAKLTPKERSIKKAQEYAEIARKKLQLVQDRDKIFQAAMNSDNARQEIAWHCAIDSYDKTGLRFKKAIAVEKIEGSSLFAELWSKIAVRYQESAEYFRKAAETQLNGNDTEVEEVDRRWEAGASYKSSAWSLESAAEALEKATVETAEGDAFLAELWNKIVMQYHELAEHYRKAAEAYSSGNDTGAKQWKKAADSAKNSALVLESAAKAPEKATAATAKGNLSFAELWSKLAVQHQELAEYYRKAAEATLSGNDKEVDRWEEAGASYKSSAWSLESAAEALEKATAATAEGKSLCAELWSKTAVQHQETAEYYRKAAEAKLSGNDAEVEHWKKAADSAVNSAWSLRSAAEGLEEATAATVEGNLSFAELWSKTAAQYQETAEHYRKVTEAQLSGNDVEVKRWKKAADFARSGVQRLESAAKALKKTTAAIVKGNLSFAELWSKTAAQYQESAEHHRKVAEAQLSGNDAEVERWKKAADSAQSSASALEAAAQYFELVTAKTARGFAELWSKSAAQYQESAEYYRKAAEAYSSRNDVEADCWKKVADFAAESHWNLTLAGEALEKATRESHWNLTRGVAELWSKSAAQYQEAADYGRRAAKAYSSGNDVEVKRWKKAADFAVSGAQRLDSAAEALEKATAAIAKGNLSFGELWSKTAAQYQESAEHYRKAIEVQLSGNDAEAEQLEKEAQSAGESAEALEKQAEELEASKEA